MVGRSGSFTALALLHPASPLQAQLPNCTPAPSDTKIAETWAGDDGLLARPASSPSPSFRIFACFDSARVELSKQNLLSDQPNFPARAKYLQASNIASTTETPGTRTVHLNPQAGLGKILASFLGPKPSMAHQCHVAGIDRETAEHLESAFERGGFVTRFGSRLCLHESMSGALTAIIHLHDDTTRWDAVFYKMWHDAFGFDSISVDEIERAKAALQAKAGDLGLQLTSGFRESDITDIGDQYDLILAILNLLPETVLKNCMLEGIHLFSESVSGKLSSYRNKWVYMYHGIMNSSERNVAGLFLHELGHATAERYRLGSEGDPSIPIGIRQAMRHCHALIANEMIGLDYAGGPNYRKDYQRGFFDEFIAELHLIYVATGPKLRRHIEEISDPEVRAAWRFIYQEIKNRIFNGYEFDYKVDTTMSTAMPRVEQLKREESSSEKQLWLSQYRFEATKQQHTFTLELAPLWDQADPFFIGRHTLPFEGISRRHALIVRLNNIFFLQDLGSKNGTSVYRNGKCLFDGHDPNRNKSPFFPLLPGDEIRLGHVRIHVRLTVREHPSER